ncbi:hypothetical protein Lal_00029774 [Lupinus albus]|uniref:Uncharacterized protein n=1 Tax=Lupinus albus TaxID=3870 RepID=A0A6A4QAD0_LUPAL|nr:hypothetical protein Lalb_Chr07g0188441 [Lupinus albus]KAF1876426.1 hypothetical protein Lal_00029774 [Lupinus albus]
MKTQHESATTITTPTTTPSTKSIADTTSSTCKCCCVVTKLMRKLKRRSRILRPSSATRQGSFQCCYDPLSYSLNFDTTGCGSLLDEDYYKFYAFSTRFVAINPKTSCPIVQVVAGNSH